VLRPSGLRSGTVSPRRTASMSTEASLELGQAIAESSLDLEHDLSGMDEGGSA
jgi:hypothetical protein